MAIFFRQITFVFFLLAGMPWCFACTQNNHIRPFDLVSDDVHKTLDEKDFKQLETWSHEYERNFSKTSDGYSALMAFFQGISYGFDSCAKHGKKTEEEWIAHQELLKEWESAYPDSMTPKLALAFFMTDYGWHARGNGYAQTVSDDAWILFKKRIASSRKQLEAIAGPCKKNPAWYNGMLWIALAQDWRPKKFEAVYRKGVKLDPYYVGLYYTRTAYLSPQWHGSIKKLKKAIDDAVRMTHRRLGETMYARLHWTYSDVDHMFENGRVDWQRMKNGFQDSLRAYPDKITRNNFARFACEAKDSETLKQQLDELGDQIMPDAWRSQRLLSYCKAYAKAKPGDKPINCYERMDTHEVFCQ